MSRGADIVEDRVALHGDPILNIAMIAKRWSMIFGVPVTPDQVCLAMIEMKVQRELTVRHPDNLDDIEGYVSIMRAFHELEKQK